MTAASELAEAIAKSGLLSADDVAKVKAAADEQADSKALARSLVKAGTLTLWQANQLLHGYTTLTIGKYRLLDQLGSGETGRVYLAEHAQMNRRHAIKILSRRQTARADVLKRFLAEAQRASALEHRNLSHVYDVNQDGEKYYLVMEYVEGQNLQKLVEKGGPLSLARAIEIVGQAIDGLLHAHDKQVVHGDLKPTNLIVDAAGTLKITDIGQGRLVEAPPTGTGEDTMEAAALASALYRAPELLDGKHAADPQCDVYSLGNVLCFLLTGKAAKDGGHAQSLLSKVKGVSAKLAELCGKMLAADPSQRPTLDEVLTELPAAVSEAGGSLTATKAAVPPMPKAKKPPVARAVAASDSESSEVIAAEAEPKAAEESAIPGLAGLTINAQPRSRAGKSAAMPVAKKSNSDSSESIHAGSGIHRSRKSAGKKSLTPILVVAALGGGVLVLGGVVFAVVFGGNWNKPAATKAVAAVVSDADRAKQKADEAAAMERDIAAAMAAIGETNPAPPGEANPAPPTSTPATGAPAASAPASTDAPAAGDSGGGVAGKSGEQTPSPPADASTAKTEPSTANATPANATPAGDAAAKPAAASTEPTKEPANPAPAKPEPTKTEPAKPEPAKPAQPALREPPTAAPRKEEPPKTAANAAAAASGASFQGLKSATSLPKLDAMMTDPPPEALASLVIGPCPPDATAQLKGGDHAMRGGRTKFALVEGKDDASLGKWDVVMSGGPEPLTIARFSIQDKQLEFQWTSDGAKHEYSPFLCNCKLVLSAGTDQHELALREPLAGESLLVDLEKPGATVKWNLDQLPDPKSIVVEISRLGEAFPAHKFDPGPTMEGLSADTLVWTGADPENALLGVKFESSQTPKYVQVKATGQFRLAGGGKSELLTRRKLQDAVGGIDSQRAQSIALEKQLTNAKVEGQKKTQRDAALKGVKERQDGINKQGEQLNQLQQLIAELKDKSEVHFRVYYVADDTQVDLVVTDQNPPKEKKAK